MLINPNGERVDYDPYPEQFRRERDLLSDEDYIAIVTDIEDFCGSHSSVSAANFSSHQTRELLAAAFRGDDEEAAICHGHILWNVLRRHPEDWWFFRPQAHGDEIAGMVYTRRT